MRRVNNPQLNLPRAYQFHRENEIRQIGGQFFDVLQEEHVEQDARLAIEGYSGPGYKNMNRLLRDDARHYPMFARNYLKSFDFAIVSREQSVEWTNALSMELSKHRVRQPFLAYRIINRRHLCRMLAFGTHRLWAHQRMFHATEQTIVGQTLREPAFSSTSLIAIETAKYEGDVLLEIMISSGVQGAAIFECSVHYCDMEFLVNRNQNFRIYAAKETTYTEFSKPRKMLYVQCITTTS